MSLPSISSGQYPYEAGVRGIDERVNPDTEMMAEKLREHGYSTYQQGIGRAPVYGAAQGFDDTLGYQDGFDRVPEVLNQEEPVFLRLHLWEPHLPYHPKQNYDRHKEGEYDLQYVSHVNRSRNYLGMGQSYLSSIYDENLRASDKGALDNLLGQLEDSGAKEDALIIIASDHGEMLQEENLTRHLMPSYRDALTSVPLIVRYPGQEEKAVDEDQASLVDIRPTIMNVAGIEKSDGLRGIDLRESREKPLFIQSSKRVHMIVEDIFRLFRCRGEQVNRHEEPVNKLCGSDSEDYILVEKKGDRYSLSENSTQYDRLLSRAEDITQTPRFRDEDGRSDESDVVRNRLEELGYMVGQE